MWNWRRERIEKGNKCYEFVTRLLKIILYPALFVAISCSLNAQTLQK